MPRRHRSHSTEFKRQVVAEYHAGETLHPPGRRLDMSRNLIRIWIEKSEAGALEEDATAAEMLSDYQARIRAASLRRPTSLRCWRAGKSGSAWTAKALGATTSL